MRVARVDAILLSCPLPEPLKLSYYGGERTILKRDAMLIRIQTDRGRVGWAPGQPTEHARDIIHDVVRPFLDGAMIADPDALRVKFFARHSSPEYRKVYCAVEVALYDLAAKDQGVAISELIGGRVRDTIRLYGSGGMYMPPEAYAEEAAAVQSLGYSAYKMRPGLGPDEDVRTVKLMREATGAGFELMVDAHTWWRMGDRSYGEETAKRLAAEIAPYDPCWLEEPLPPHDHDAYIRLRESAEICIASGEHEQSDESFYDLMSRECVDYVQADLVCQGGYASGRRILADCQQHGLRFAFHSWGTDLEVLAAAQMGICWPESVVEWLEYPLYRREGVPVLYPFALATEILAEPLSITAGELTVPRSAGLGIAINEAVIDKYPWLPGPWSTFKLISPPGEFAVIGDHSVPWGQ